MRVLLITKPALAAVLGLLLALPACAQQAPGDGSLLIVGGALKATNEEVHQAFINGLLPEGPVVVIPAASGSPASSGQSMADALITHGVAPDRLVVFPLAMKDDTKTEEVDERSWRDNAWDPDLLKRANNAAGFWFTGGDQMRIVSVLRSAERGESPLLELVRERLKAGAIVGGTSAGAAIMSHHMIVGGNSFSALLAEGTEPYVEDEAQLTGALGLDRGLGFLPLGVVDQHFDRQARLGRLVRALAETGQRYGYGIDEDTGLLIDLATLDARVVGSASVTLLDVGDAKFDFKQHTSKPASQSQLMQGARLSIAHSGAHISLKNHRFEGQLGEATIDNEYYSHKTSPGGGMAFPQRSLAQTLGRGLVDNRSSRSVKSYSLNCRGDILVYRFTQNKRSKGFWQDTPKGGRYIVQDVEFSIESGRAEGLGLKDPC